MRRASIFCWALASLAAGIVGSPSPAVAAPLFSNGPLITSPTGGTGAIAGQPLSRPETIPIGGNLASGVTGVGAAGALGLKVADDFVVPDGGWDLDAITVYAFQASSFTQTIATARLNLWAATPYTADSPDLPPATPIPQPLLAQPLTFDVTNRGTFVAHRTSGSSTTTVRPIWSYTLSAEGLPGGGRLAAGRYWLELSFDDAAATHANVLVPLVTPRAEAFNVNARQFTVPLPGIPPTWFEGREGYQNAANPGRPYALPFELTGTPEPASLLTLAIAPAIAARRRRR